MITDEKRRRVVHTLRQLDNVVDNEHMDRTIEHDSIILSMIRDATFGLDGSIFQRLADLIDRPDNPTCRNLSNDERSFHCSRYGDSDCDPEDFAYCPECPNCGEQINNGRVFVCEKGKQLMREVKYRRGHCDLVIIFIKKCEPEVTGR